ncbi:centrosomal protein CCDC61-like isoform X1 [Crassostrea virginica]
MEVPDETTLSTSYVFRGIEYIITMIIQGGNSLTVEVEDRLTADQWRAQFDSAYIEDLTHKTGNFKQFHIFTSMLESAITQSSDSVSLDLLTFADLESLRQRKVGTATKTSIPANRTVSLNSKRYLILTYTVEFDRIHYPLPLPYMGKPDPRALQETIRQLREELKSLRHQQGSSDFRIKEVEKLQKENKALLKEKEEIEEEFLRFRREMKSTSTGSAVKEIRMLKSVTKNLEEELLKEKTRHQRSTSKRSQEYRDLLEEVEELRASERNLRVRVKSLTNELAVYKRDRVRSSRPPARERLNTSRDRSGSFSRERSLSRERSWSSDRLSARERSLSRDRPSSRERPSSANNSRFSNRSSSSYSNRNNYKPRSRTPSPAGARNPRFDPTAYIKDKERKKKEASMKKSVSEKEQKRNIKSNISGVSNRSNPSPQHISRSIRNRSRTSSFGSAGELSDGGFSDSSYSRLRVLNRHPPRSQGGRNHQRNGSVDSSKGSYLSSPDIPQKSRSRTGSGREPKIPVSSTPDTETRTRRKRPSRKENIPLSGDDSDSFDRSAEISEIDARLARLQQMMKNSLD